MQEVCPYYTKMEAGTRMPLMREFDIPTLAEAFGDRKSLMKSLHKAGFKSIVPLMMMPREALLELPGIGMSSVLVISRTLKKHRLSQHVFSDRMSVFIDKQFGCIEDAPISVLQVTIVRNDQLNRPVFAPLEIISLLEDIEPRMTVMDLIRMSREEIRVMVQVQSSFGLHLHDLAEDLKHLAIRLGNFDLEFGAQLPIQLRAVNHQ